MCWRTALWQAKHIALRLERMRPLPWPAHLLHAWAAAGVAAARWWMGQCLCCASCSVLRPG